MTPKLPPPAARDVDKQFMPEHVAMLDASCPPQQIGYNSHGQLTWRDACGTPIPIQPVAAFVLSAPRRHISLVDAQGRERAYIPQLDALPAPCRQAIETSLALREFVPTITVIHAVSSFATPSTWSVETDHGPTQLVLQSEDDIRRLGAEGQALRITDKNSLQYQIPDIARLPKASRRLLARFI